ncbi:MAG TPA: hypothetical protein VFE41_07845 [Acetobacteraceae bacterium]|jgi:hypothetical protein|nr:hypothetical protein [Acetobacteraceae bacterium]
MHAKHADGDSLNEPPGHEVGSVFTVLNVFGTSLHKLEIKPVILCL